MRGTLRMPNAIDTASKLLSGNGSASALASTNVTASSSACAQRALAPDAEHVGIDVRDGRARAAAARRDGAERDVAGAARDVEQREIPLDSGRIDRRDQRVLPGAMQPGRHQVVHQVVAPRHLVEHVVDQRLLVAERHVAKAEMGLVAHGDDHSAAAAAALHNAVALRG